MPELVYSDEELGLVKGWDEHLDPNIRRELKDARITSKKLAEQQAEIDALKRADAFRRAGIPDDKRGDAFARIAQADASQPEALKAEWEEFAGLFGPIDPDEKAKAEELAAAQRIAQTGGTQSGAPGTKDFKDAIWDPDLTREQVIELLKNAPAETGIRVAPPQ